MDSIRGGLRGVVPGPSPGKKTVWDVLEAEGRNLERSLFKELGLDRKDADIHSMSQDQLHKVVAKKDLCKARWGFPFIGSRKFNNYVPRFAWLWWSAIQTSVKGEVGKVLV
jgi:hypothetical protein